MKPVLYLFVGYPGAGKTTIAQIIAKATGGTHLWADQERNKLFGKPTHSTEESNQLYAELNFETDQLLGEGKTVIFDTNFNFRADREHLRSIAAKHGAKTRILWVTTPEELAKDRATSEKAVLRNGYESRMSPEEFNTIANKLEAPTDDEQPIIIDGTQVDEQAVLTQLGLK